MKFLQKLIFVYIQLFIDSWNKIVKPSLYVALQPTFLQTNLIQDPTGN